MWPKFMQTSRCDGAVAGRYPALPGAGSRQAEALSQHDVRQLLALSGVERDTAKVTGSETVTVTTENATRAGSSPNGRWWQRRAASDV